MNGFVHTNSLAMPLEKSMSVSSFEERSGGISRCRVERSFLWEITGSLAVAGKDLRVGNQLLFSKPKIIVKQTVSNRAHTKDPRPTSSIQC